ncbi:MAG TPA: carbon-nitrogen hydrolase family protein [Bacteroidia bacterium]|jgi:predicted amidohydrolase|nr:carbon-nitrogen hydrolase family protein [Bacteroidia bacterium]
MILASAQTKPIKGDINANLADHYRLIQAAADKGADLIIFPEMSISGYERENARELSFSKDDSRLHGLQGLSDKYNIIIVAGAPLLINAGLYIGAFIVRPHKAVSVYTKQFLHEGEDKFFEPSFEHNPQIHLNDESISVAICADIDHPLHAENARKANSTIYAAGIFFSPNGIQQAHQLLGAYAKEHGMCVLMSNYGGDSWGMASGGRSAFWNERGEHIAEMDSSGSGLLLIEKKDNKWIGQVISDRS